jgi:hypothetical protein
MPTINTDPVRYFDASILGRRSLFVSVGSPVNKGFVGLIGKQRALFSGSGVIAGTVTVEGTPAARQVRLFDKKTGLLIDETLSQANGAYQFDRLELAREYFVVSHDYTRVFNAVIQDMVTA